MELKPQDIVVAIDLACSGESPGWAYVRENPLSARSVAKRLQMALGAVSESQKRLRALGLASYNVQSQVAVTRANKSTMLEFFVYGVKHYSHPEVVGVGRGMATSWTAPPVVEMSDMVLPETPLVWPDPSGNTRGEQITPIHKSAVPLAKINRQAYMILALLDVMRLGKFREQDVAKKLLTELLSG